MRVPLLWSLCVFFVVHREQQGSLAHADREDQRLVLLSRLMLRYRWPAWHLSKSGGSTWACSRGTLTDSAAEARSFQVTNIPQVLLCDFNHFVFSSRDLEEREDQEDLQEKPDQRCVKYFTTTFLAYIVVQVHHLLLILSLQGNSGNDGPPGPPGERVRTITLSSRVILVS